MRASAGPLQLHDRPGMILDTIFRWLWLAVAFCFSAFVAIVILFALGSVWMGEAVREAAARSGDPVIWQASGVLGALFFTAAVLPAMTALPGFILAVTGEIFRIRSALYYTIAGGVSIAAIPFLAAPPDAAETPPAADYMVLFAAAGFAGGFTYWLLAGRKA